MWEFTDIRSRQSGILIIPVLKREPRNFVGHPPAPLCSLSGTLPAGGSEIRHAQAREKNYISICAAKRGSAEHAFSLSPAAGVCVCVCVCFWFGHPAPQALSPSQCPQLSTRVRDHRGKSFCSCEVGCLAKCPIQPKPRSLGGRAHGGSGGTFPCLD